MKKKIIIFESIKGAGKTVLINELKKLLPNSVVYGEKVTLYPVKHSNVKGDMVSHYKSICDQIEQADAKYFLLDRLHFTKWPIEQYEKDYFVGIEKALIKKFDTTLIFPYIDNDTILERLQHTQNHRLSDGWKLNYDSSSIEDEARKDIAWQDFFLKHQYQDTLIQNKLKINTTILHSNLDNLKPYVQQIIKHLYQ